jgi:tyrosyl-tRNA synthetase
MRLLTDIPEEEIGEYQRFLEINPKEIKIILAKNIVEFFHGKDKAEEAYVEFERVHKKRLVPTKLEEFIVDKEYQPIVTLIVNSGLASSRSEAKRYILQKAVRINNKEIITDINYIVHIKKDLILQVGRRKFVKICLSKN